MKLHFFKLKLFFLLIASASSFIAADVIDALTVRDFELTSSVNGTHQGVCDVLAQPKMVAGKAVLRSMIVDPLVDVDAILKRQNVIKALVGDVVLLEQLEALLSKIAEHEKKLNAFDPAQQNSAVSQMFASLFFSARGLAGLNKSSVALNTRHALEYFTPVGVFALEHLVLHFAAQHLTKKNKPKGAAPHVHGAGCGHAHGAGHACVGNAKAKDDAPFHIKAVVGAAKFAHAGHHAVGIFYSLCALHARMKIVNELYQSIISLNDFLTEVKGISWLSSDVVLAELAPIHKDLNGITSILDVEYFKPNTHLNIISGVGKTLTTYLDLREKFDDFQRIIQCVAHLDVYAALARTMVDAQSSSAKFCFTKFSEVAGPALNMLNGWHVMMNRCKLQANSFAARHGEGASAKYVLSGPNGSGKSSFLRTLGVNAVLSQTFGIAAADEFSLAPFHKILSFMTIVDDIHVGHSSFVARMMRANKCLDEQVALGENQYCLALLDDSVGQGTSIIRGEKTAYQFIKSMGLHGDTILVAATHYDKIKNMSTDPYSLFRSIRMRVAKDSSGKSRPEYVLEPGISDSADVGVLVDEV